MLWGRHVWSSAGRYIVKAMQYIRTVGLILFNFTFNIFVFGGLHELEYVWMMMVIIALLYKCARNDVYAFVFVQSARALSYSQDFNFHRKSQTNRKEPDEGFFFLRFVRLVKCLNYYEHFVNESCCHFILELVFFFVWFGEWRVFYIVGFAISYTTFWLQIVCQFYGYFLKCLNYFVEKNVHWKHRSFAIDFEFQLNYDR